MSDDTPIPVHVQRYLDSDEACFNRIASASDEELDRVLDDIADAPFAEEDIDLLELAPPVPDDEEMAARQTWAYHFARLCGVDSRTFFGWVDELMAADGWQLEAAMVNLRQMHETDTPVRMVLLSNELQRRGLMSVLLGDHAMHEARSRAAEVLKMLRTP